MNEQLRVKMLVDFMASSFGSTDDEYDEIEQSLKRLFPEIALSFDRQVFMHDLKKLAYDIFVFDWGGLMPGSEGTTRSIYHALLSETRKYGKDRLYIMWSSFTERYFKDAANEEFPEFIAPNVVYAQDENYEKRCRLFFGLSSEIPKVNDGKDYTLISPPKRPPVRMTFCQIDDALVEIIQKEAKERIVVDCGAGEGLLDEKMPDGSVISIDIIPKNNPRVLLIDSRIFCFTDEHIPIFVRPCHSGFVEDTLLYAMNRVNSALYISNPKNLEEDLGVFSKLALLIHDEWEGSDDNERIYRIPFTKEENSLP